MTRGKIEDFSTVSLECDSATENISTFIPGHENNFSVIGNIETFAIHFGMRNHKGFRDSLRYRMFRRNHPDTFLFSGFTPSQTAAGAHHPFKYLGGMA